METAIESSVARLDNRWRLRRVGQCVRVAAASLVLLLGVVSCDDASPVAPTGSTLIISANPDRIAADGEATVRVIARKPNGNAVNPGTVIRFTTSLGTIPSSVPTDDIGEAVATLEGTGQQGMATVRASTGASEEVTVDVRIGLVAGGISVQATPTGVPETGGEVSLLAIVRDEEGQALAGATVNFSTETGTLASGGQLIATDASGSAVDTLSVTDGDLQTIQGDTFMVNVDVGGSGGNLSGTTTISIQRLPRANFTLTANRLTVVFMDTSTGNPTSWVWDFGDGQTSTQQNPTNTYSAAGTFTVTLTARNSQGAGEFSRNVTVTAQ